MAGKGSRGNFFEDFSLGMRILHPVPRTVHAADTSLYVALTGERRPLSSSAEFARALGFSRELCPDLLTFHLVFGKTVVDVSLNAVANLGYADVRFLRPARPGDTLRAESEVIGLRETSSGKAGVVYVRTRGIDQEDREVLRYVRWVLVEKRTRSSGSGGPAEVPELPESVAVPDLPVPEELDLSRFQEVAWATGGGALWEDYEVGERIDHQNGMTIDEVDHTAATRLYQNTARVHFDQHKMQTSRFGRRLVYGGHVISVAHALAHNGLENVLFMVAWNRGHHANPTGAGDTIYAWSEVLERAELPGRTDLGALRLRLCAVKNADPSSEDLAENDPRLVLDLDWWGLIPRRPG